MNIITKYGFYKLKILNAYHAVTKRGYKGVYLVLGDESKSVKVFNAIRSPKGGRSMFAKQVLDMMVLGDIGELVGVEAQGTDLVYDKITKKRHFIEREFKECYVDLVGLTFLFEISVFKKPNKEGKVDYIYHILNVFHPQTNQSAKEYENNVLAQIFSKGEGDES